VGCVRLGLRCCVSPCARHAYALRTPRVRPAHATRTPCGRHACARGDRGVCPMPDRVPKDGPGRTKRRPFQAPVSHLSPCRRPSQCQSMARRRGNLASAPPRQERTAGLAPTAEHRPSRGPCGSSVKFCGALREGPRKCALLTLHHWVAAAQGGRQQARRASPWCGEHGAFVTDRSSVTVEGVWAPAAAPERKESPVYRGGAVKGRAGGGLWRALRVRWINDGKESNIARRH